jgi:hypothetical protein
MTLEEKDTQDWLAILSGQTVEGAALETVREARVLRAVLQYRYSPPQISPQSYEKMTTQLIARGLLLKPNDSNVVTLPTRPRPKFPQTWQVGLSLAASLLLAVLLLFPGIKDRWGGDSSPLEKGRGGDEVITLQVANPQETTTQLQTELTKLGVKVMVRQEVDGWRLEVSELNTTNNPIALSDLLGRYEIPQSSDKLVLKITQKKPL